MKAVSESGFLESVRKAVVFDDVPFAHQLGGAVALTLGAGIGAQVMGAVNFSEWKPWIVYWIGGIVAAPHLLKGAANLLWTLGLNVALTLWLYRRFVRRSEL